MSNDLFKKVIDLTQLPSDEISQELEKLLESQGDSGDRVSLGQLRQALAQYIHEVFAQNEMVVKITDEAEFLDDPNITLSLVH